MRIIRFVTDTSGKGRGTTYRRVDRCADQTSRRARSIVSCVGVNEARTCVTTGANSGIGLATVLELARRGFRSVGTVRSTAKAEIVANAAADAGVQVDTRILDVTDAGTCEAVIDELRPWALINNAGYSITGSVEDVTDDEARAAFETMVFAPMRLARLAIPHMRAERSGCIVNVSSIYGRTTTPLTGWYQGAKHALEGLSDALRMEVARDGVRVILVEPGGFKTGIWEETEREIMKREGSRYDNAYQRTLSTTKLLQVLMGEPQQCAKVIASALTSRIPRTRYLVGYDAQALALLDSLTPTQIKDRVVRLMMSL
jgi:short-subunit dehydrogenase